ncbi:MAG: TIGR04255 family protein [Solirubrobacteraceae bacterium MAG38_C4-C5]|nr:TIGR04255 family protein [Candidatus Siliceabacter maunaloa]
MEPAIETIVEFERPPVIEVVFGTQFGAAIVDLEVLAEFARSVRGEFPRREQIEPLPRAFESFDHPPAGTHIEFRFGGAPLPRTRFISTDEQTLLQLQADRFLFNWRRVSADDAYPRYETLRPRFDALRQRLIEVLDGLGRPTPVVDHVEVSYINELSFPGHPSARTHASLSALVSTVSDLPRGGFLSEPEDVGYSARFRIPRADGTGPMGRLIARTEPAYRSADGRPIHLLTLTANLVGSFASDTAVIDALDLGRRWVVNGFLEMTTPELHANWRRL